MSTPQPRPVEPSSGASGGDAGRRVDERVLIGLLALSAIGIGITDFSPRYGLWYWIAMVPVFGGTSLFAVWSRARSRGETAGRVLRTQLFHWLGLLLAVELVFLLHSSGRLDDEVAGLVAMLALALATFLAGVHGDWRLVLLGVLLGAGVACAALVEEYLWVLLIPAAVAGAVLVQRWRQGVRRAREGEGQTREAAAAATPSPPPPRAAETAASDEAD